MKKNFIAFVCAMAFITACNDKPEAPMSSQILSVYPVPASDRAHITVQNPNGDNLTLQVYNTKGKVMMERNVSNGTQEYTLPLSDEPAGKYQVILKAGEVVATQMIIKI